MRVKHGAQFAMTLRSGRSVLERAVVEPDMIGATQTVWAYTYGGISGQVCWRHPVTGRPIAKPKVTVTLVNPDDELTGDQLCDCDRCMEGAA